MKDIGKTLKDYIEQNQLVKKHIAEQAGISVNYLSTIFKQKTVDAALLERLCLAAGIHPAVMFDVPEELNSKFKDIWAKTLIGKAQVQINENDSLRELIAEKDRVIAEKERTIQILMAQSGLVVPGQNRDNYDK